MDLASRAYSNNGERGIHKLHNEDKRNQRTWALQAWSHDTSSSDTMGAVEEQLLESILGQAPVYVLCQVRDIFMSCAPTGQVH